MGGGEQVEAVRGVGDEGVEGAAGPAEKEGADDLLCFVCVGVGVFVCWFIYYLLFLFWWV